MNVLHQLTQPQIQMTIALPYRVGLFVSKADKTGGAEADKKERQALENIIDGFAESMLGSEPLQYIMTETMKHKPNWGQWGENLKDVPRECRDVIDTLAIHLNEKDKAAFVAYMMQIGEAVAQAFREQEHLGTVQQKIKIYSKYGHSVVQSVLNKQTIKSLDEFLSVSTDERRALARLAKAMYTFYF